MRWRVSDRLTDQPMDHLLQPDTWLRQVGPSVDVEGDVCLT